jgi:CRISPR-associated protein Csm1
MAQVLDTLNVALQIAQQAVTLLATWANPLYKSKYPQSPLYNAVNKAQHLLSWPDKSTLQPLRLLFDNVKLSQGQSNVHYCFPRSIKNTHPTVPYPAIKELIDSDFHEIKKQINQAIASLKDEDWKNLSLLMLFVEKFGSFLSFGEPDVALVDITRATSAVAAALANNPEAEQITLIAGDLSGIQKFIYTISSDGALKSLRARSFFLELVIQEVVQQIIEELNLPITNVIYAGGGNFYIIGSSELEQVKKSVNTIAQKFNKWLWNSFKGQLFLAINSLYVPTQSFIDKNFTDYWTQVTKDLAKQKARKFNQELNIVIQPSSSHQPCKVCHRDDLPSLKPLIRGNDDSSPACWMCCNMFELGERLFNVKALLRSQRSNVKGSVEKKRIERIYVSGYYYYLCTTREEAVRLAQNGETIFIINDWNLSNYKLGNTSLLLLGNYGQKNEEEKRFIRGEEMSKASQLVGAIPRVGYLRMDVDKLGRIFAEGLDKKNRSLPKIAGLSRQMSYFFKVYLNSLASNRKQNLPETVKKLKPDDDRLNLLFIYAGGDDLFITGAWNEIVEFAFDIYQSFRYYTGYNPDITLSGGISIDDFKFPLYQAAKTAEKAEDDAKDNGRDSLGLFGQVFKWDEWLGIKDLELVSEEIQNYLHSEYKPELLGIFPFVETLQQKNIRADYSRNFVRNLLITAQIQEEALKKFNNKKSEEALGTRYYLHLPKIAYTLARLPKDILDDDAFRTSLKSPYNAPYFRAIATWIELLNRSS